MNDDGLILRRIFVLLVDKAIKSHNVIVIGLMQPQSIMCR